ncbi:MAG: helix-turn-helix domain-containing protein [Smithella sp.]
MEKICIVRRRQQYAQPEVKLPQPEKIDTIPTQAVVSSIAIDNRIAFPDKKPDKKIEEEYLNSINMQNQSESPDKKMVEEFVRSFAMENQSEFPDKETAEEFVSSVAMENQKEFPDKKIVEEFIDNSSSVISIIMTKEQSTLLQQSEYIKELLSGTKNDPSFDIKLNADGQLAINFRFNDSLLIRMLAPNQVCQMLQVSRSFLQKLVHENKIKSYKLGRMRRFLLEDILEYLSNDAQFAQLNNEH